MIKIKYLSGKIVGIPAASIESVEIDENNNCMIYICGKAHEWYQFSTTKNEAAEVSEEHFKELVEELLSL